MAVFILDPLNIGPRRTSDRSRGGRPQCTSFRAFGPALRYHGAPRAPPQRAPRFPLTCARPPYPPLRRLDASPRRAALDDRAGGGDPGGLADRLPLRSPAQRHRGAPAARRPERGGDPGAAEPHGRAAVPGRHRRRRRPRPPAGGRAVPGGSRRARPPLPEERGQRRAHRLRGGAGLRREARRQPDGARRSEDDPGADRGPPPLGVRQEDRHAARRRRAGAAARLQRHRAQVRRPARRRRPRGESLLQPPAGPDADADRGRRLLDQRRAGRRRSSTRSRTTCGRWAGPAPTPPACRSG